MADTIELELIETSEIESTPYFWSNWLMMKNLLGANRHPIVLHFDVIADSITNSLAELAAPTNKVLNFATPEQVYVRSDAAGDTSKKIDVIGQKADGSFGQFTLTSDDTDGTTPVDVGTWNFISFVIKNDAWAGNVIIDDDGASTTVYWTAALGATATTGIIVVPTGYKGTVLTVSSWLLEAPPNVNANDRFEIGEDFGWSLNSYNQYYSSGIEQYRHLEHASTQVKVQGVYTGADETDAAIEGYFIIWED